MDGSLVDSKKMHDLEEADRRKLSTCLYPMYEIISEEEEYESKKDALLEKCKLETLSADIQQMNVTDANGTAEEEEEDWDDSVYEETPESEVMDKQFLKFQKRIEHDPDQILR